MTASARAACYEAAQHDADGRGFAAPLIARALDGARMKKWQSLVSVLKDITAREDERDDAAMDLDAFDGGEVEDALLLVASDPKESAIVASSAGESLGTIWARKREIPGGVIAQLRPDARSEAEAVLQAKVPLLIGCKSNAGGES